MTGIPPSLQAQQTPLGKTHGLLVMLVAAVAGAAAWAHMGRLDVVSLAAGEVVPSTQVKTVQHLEGGIVSEIMVREGDTVKQGQALVSLEQIREGASVEEASVRLANLKAAVVRLRAEVDGAKRLSFPADFADAEPDLVRETEALFTSRKKRLEAELKRQRSVITERRREVDEINTRLRENRKRLKIAEEQVTISEDLVREQLSNRFRHLDLVQAAATIKADIARDRSALSRAKAAIRTAEVGVEEIKTEAQEEAREDLAASQRELDELENRARRFDDALERTVLRAPVDGIVKQLHVVTVGGVVAPGGAVADVVPQGDRLIIEARLPPQEIGFVSTGQSARIRLASSDAGRFGHIDGTVQQVSPDTIDAAEGGAFYKIRIATRRDYFERNGLRYQLVPGVQVETAIRTGERSVLAYIIDPLTGDLDRALSER